MSFDPIKDGTAALTSAADHVGQELPGVLAETVSQIADRLDADEITITGEFKIKIGFGKKA